MTFTLEVPFPPGRPDIPGSRLEPPFVAVELGGEHWELTGVAPAGDRLHFSFTRERRFWA